MTFVILAISVASGQFEATLLVPLAVILLAVAVFGWMTVMVSEQSVTVRMGVGLMSRTVDINRVHRYELVRNPWYRGVGVRLYPGGTSFSVWGFEAVEMVTGDGNVRIGSDEPDKLLAAIRAART